MQKNINDTICPFCHSKNQCMAHVEAPCWCNSVSVPNELQVIVPEETKGKICICLSCIQLFKNSPEIFKKKYVSCPV
jgi:hypothetical protein